MKVVSILILYYLERNKKYFLNSEIDKYLKILKITIKVKEINCVIFNLIQISELRKYVKWYKMLNYNMPKIR